MRQVKNQTKKVGLVRSKSIWTGAALFLLLDPVSWDGMFSVCIYCKRSYPEAKPSEAHILPYALGGTETSAETVCDECNGRVNRDVETPALEHFRLFRSLLGIEGRRDGVPGVPAIMRVEGREIRTVLGPGLTPTTPLYDVQEDEQGKKSYFAYGPNDVRQAFTEAISRKRPGVNWRTSNYIVEIEAVADGPQLEDPILRRLAAKVAFERYAQLRSAALAAGWEFEGVREFILTGVEAEPCCGITADPLLLNGSFNLPVPAHGVALVFHEADPIVGGFVMFFGLYLSWVILTKRYRALGSQDDLLIEWPQVRQSERPLRSGLGAIRVPWAKYIDEFTRDRLATIRAANHASGVKFKALVDAAHGRTQP